MKRLHTFRALLTRLVHRIGVRDAELLTDIDDEFAFHLQRTTNDLIADGCSDDDAAIKAIERFGDVDRIKSQCRHIALKERIMLQRVNFVLLMIILLAVGYVSVRTYATQRQNIIASGHVYLDGDIRRPGVYAVRPDGRLMLSQLMLSAGLDALPVDVNVMRQVGGEEKVVWTGSFTTIRDLGRGIALAAEDRVTITRSPGYSSIGFINVDGDVPHPARYGFLRSESLTLSQLFASPDGSDRDAMHLRVIRTVDDAPKKVFDRRIDDWGDLAQNDFSLESNDLLLISATKDM